MDENTHTRVALQGSDIWRGFQNAVYHLMQKWKKKGHLHDRSIHVLVKGGHFRRICSHASKSMYITAWQSTDYKSMEWVELEITHLPSPRAMQFLLRNRYGWWRDRKPLPLASDCFGSCKWQIILFLSIYTPGGLPMCQTQAGGNKRIIRQDPWNQSDNNPWETLFNKTAAKNLAHSRCLIKICCLGSPVYKQG